MAAGKQVRLFLVDGTAGGLITAEIMNWTGHVLKGTRDKLAAIRSRPEAQRTGVYILLGEDEQTGDAMAYIGQSDDVAKRLTHHDRDEKKAFWNDVLVITSKDQNLTSAHVRFLESRLVRLAKSIGRTPLPTATNPPAAPTCPKQTYRTWTTSSNNSASFCRSSVSTSSAGAKHGLLRRRSPRRRPTSQ